MQGTPSPRVRAPRRWLAPLLAVSLASLPCSVACVRAEAPLPDESEYKRTIEAALEEYQLGHFEEARGLFQHAHDLEPSARTLRGLGMVEFELRHYVAARRLLEASLTSADKPLTAEQRASVEQLLDRSRHFVARYRIDVSPAGAEAVLELDGRPVQLEHGALPMTTGEHTLRVRADGFAPQSVRLDAQGGEERALQVTLQPGRDAASAPVARTTRPHRTLGIVLTSIGGAALATGALLGGLALAKASDAPDRDGPDADQARGLGLGSDVSFGIGAASAITGLVLLLVKRREQPVTAGVRVESVAPQLRVRF